MGWESIIFHSLNLKEYYKTKDFSTSTFTWVRETNMQEILLTEGKK